VDSNPQYNSEPVKSDVCASYVESTLVRELIVAEWCLSARTSPVSVESKSRHGAIRELRFQDSRPCILSPEPDRNGLPNQCWLREAPSSSRMSFNKGFAIGINNGSREGFHCLQPKLDNLFSSVDVGRNETMHNKRRISRASDCIGFMATLNLKV
jgi:hypothetical protein